MNSSESDDASPPSASVRPDNEPLARIRRVIGDSPADLAVSGLRGAAVPLVLAGALAAHDGPALVVCADGEVAKRLIAETRAFLPNDGSRERLLPYPPWDIAPYESVSPHAAIVASRMASLSALLEPRSRAVVVAPVGALLKRVVPREKVLASSLALAVGEEADRDLCVLALEESGYHRVTLVEDVGEYAVRGGVVDFWSPLEHEPVRIEFDGDEIRSIRVFSPARQTTRKHIDRTRIFACRELLIDAPARAAFAARVKAVADDQDVERRVRERLVDEVQSRIHGPGMEFLLPLFFERLDTVADYLPGETLVVDVQPDLLDAMAEVENDLVHKRRAQAREAGKLCVEATTLYQSPSEVFERLDGFRSLTLGDVAPSRRGRGERIHLESQTLTTLREEIIARAQDEHMLEPLVARLRAWLREERRIALVARQPSGVDRLRRLLGTYEFRTRTTTDEPALDLGHVVSSPPGPVIPILEADLSGGVVMDDIRVAIVTEEEIFGKRRHGDRVASRKGEAIADFGDIAPGDAIVHVQHGIAVYQGLAKLAVRGYDGEFLALEYAGGDKLYLPVDRLSQVQRYVGTGGAAVLDRLGGTSWEKAKDKARGSIQAMARQLLSLYAMRAQQQGHAFGDGGETFTEFEETFPFEETPDQLQAITDVVADLRSPKPMDRLICGDVGFGKTEVALRAAFLAVLDGKQVAVLVPTTTLAFQHARTFASRMAAFGVNVRSLSRFVSDAERKKIREGLAAGTVDVVIGTHNLLSSRMKYRDLGLLVVDEEQLFGVAQKEKIKAMKQLVDVLTLSATPIPRTLHMSLMGIRDFSIINTPPEDRLAVRTFVTRWDDDTIREALRRELERGGQVFVIHNRIQSIDGVAARISRLAPGARVRIGHGQMPGDEIEELLIDFAEGRFDILVATTIVGSGLDFPRANTMLIHRADLLGLAQLYQLRGRVGRSKVRAYCYLIVPDTDEVTEDARKRLAAIRTFTELGSGYKIAAKDLEIRGAGNLLGSEQSGHIAAIGYELYRELVDDEVRRLRGEVVAPRIETEVNLPVPAILPEEYVPEAPLRLSMYKAIADAPDEDVLTNLRGELLDRFGPLPAPAENLFSVMRVKIRGNRLGLRSVEYGKDHLIFAFHEHTPMSASDLVRLVGAAPDRYRLLPDGKLMEKIGKTEPEALWEGLDRALHALESCVINRGFSRT